MMTQDMCPFLSKEHKVKPCPGCKMITTWTKDTGHDVILNQCLNEISKKVESAITSNKQKTLPFELYKLRILTTSEEEHPLDIISIKKKAQRTLDSIETHHHPENFDKEIQFHLYVGDVLFNLGEYTKALEYYNQASRKAPDEKRAWNNIGVTKVRQGMVKEALSYYDRALKLDPAFGSAWFNKGKAMFKLGMEKKALDCFKKATKFSPENKSAWNNLGVTLRHLKKFKESIKCYDRAIKIHSEYPWAWHNKGVALMELKRYKEAMQCFDKALFIDPDYEPAKESKRDVMRKLM
ncbi:MAG: tetratricopeptide repeat protein [Methanomassiliicoccales archaeon]|nr:MAG: tetratricopeptide repeat protein [Methanomassiliicoccales archaeon]